MEISNFKNNVIADFLILFKSNFVRSSILVALLLYSFVLYSASDLQSITSSKGYYTSQMLITITFLNLFLIIIIGAMLGAKDFEWKTFNIRFVDTSRTKIAFCRIFVILICSIVFVVTSILIGSIFDMLANTLETLSLFQVTKYAVVVLVLFFWGLLAYLISFVSTKFSVGTTLCVGYLFMESFLEKYIPNEIIKIFPVWNHKNLLKYYFDENEGAVAIVLNHQGDSVLSFVMILIFLFLILFLILRFSKKEITK